MYSSGRPPSLIDSWRIAKKELEVRIEKGNRDEVPILRFQIEELDWLINNGNTVRTQREIESEYDGLVAQREGAEGTERLKLQMKASILEQYVPYPLGREHKQMVSDGRKRFERIEQLKAKFADGQLIESASEKTEIEVKARSGRLIHILLIFPRQRSARLPAIIVTHDNEGATKFIQNAAKRLALAGYAVAIPFLEYGHNSSWNELQGVAEDLESVLDYLRGRNDIDRYVVGSLGFGVGGTCSLILATRSQYLRACFTLWSEVPSFETLQTGNLRAALSFVQLADDKNSAERYSLLRDAWWKAVRTARGRMGFGAVIENVSNNFLDEDSPEYSSQPATPVWSNIILFFDQELMEDRSSLPSDQVGIQFCKLSTSEKELYLARMKNDPSFSKEVVRGFYAFARGQLDEDKTVFEALRLDPDLARERGRIAAANFTSHSEGEKHAFLDEARKNEFFAEGFVGNSSVPLAHNPDRQPLAAYDRRAIFELALSSPKSMRAFGRSRGEQFAHLSTTNKRETLQLIIGAKVTDSQVEWTDDNLLRNEFSVGFGERLPFHIFELNQEDLAAIRTLIQENAEFAEGLKNNLKITMNQVGKEDNEKLWKQFAWLPKFARGLGISYGLGFARLPKEEGKPFLDFGKKSEYFLEGCGYGFGLIEKKLDKSELELADSLFTKDSAFKKGYEESTKP